ncbi:glycosyltransferase [Aquincola sp. MAHUQ-54]|uniref:Glycosyltransferase n=1 Tax=Aquincola agrisoli TaxID=3119538 RepID=A0AAW9QCB0_9BURK
MASLVTVIIPAYNCAATVAETLESALAQDHPATEIIVVNDGSTDGTLDVLRRFGDRIRVIDQKNAGPPAARNAALQAARGDYIAFLDADDVWVQGKLAAQARHLDRHADVGTVFTHWHVWMPEADGSFKRRPDIEARHVDDSVDAVNSGWLYTRLLFDCELLTTTVMLRGSMVKRLGGFDLQLWNGDDYDYWLRCSREGKITKLASTGALYRILPNSVSRRPREVNYEHEVIASAVKRWGLTGPDGSEADPVRLQRRLHDLQVAHAYTHLLRGDAAVAFNGYRDALARRPNELKLWMNTARAAMKLGLRGAGKGVG